MTPIFALRFMISTAYLAMISPFIIFALTGDKLFAGLSIAFAMLGIILLPRAIHDWNFKC